MMGFRWAKAARLLLNQHSASAVRRNNRRQCSRILQLRCGGPQREPLDLSARSSSNEGAEDKAGFRCPPTAGDSRLGTSPFRHSSTREGVERGPNDHRKLDSKSENSEHETRSRPEVRSQPGDGGFGSIRAKSGLKAEEGGGAAQDADRVSERSRSYCSGPLYGSLHRC